jgi:hypothetical protein
MEYNGDHSEYYGESGEYDDVYGNCDGGEWLYGK